MVQVVNHLHVLSDESFALTVRPLDWTDSRALLQSVAEAVAVPTGARYVVFGADVNFAVRYNAALAGTAAAFADTTNGTGVEINPTIRYLVGVAEISVITAATAGNVSLSFFK